MSLNVSYRYIPLIRREASDGVPVIGPPTVDFVFDVDRAPPTVFFEARQTGIVTSFFWELGQGGATSTNQNTIFTYDVPPQTSQQFTVRLTINGSIFEEKVITVFNPEAAAPPTQLAALTLSVDEALNMTVNEALILKIS